MKIEVLISTMNLIDNDALIKKMKITGPSLTINQITKKGLNLLNNKGQNSILSYLEKGLSRSRNKALINSNCDICVIADDDMYYEGNYLESITNAYTKYPDADIIIFVVDNEDIAHKKKIQKEGRISYLKSLKVQSVQMTFKRESILKNNIKFDEHFGAGSTYYWGEENIFLFDCLRKGLKIYYVPVKIATLEISTSSWDKSNTRQHYNIQGIVYYRMSKYFYPILITQFALRKGKIYRPDLNFFQVMHHMFEGARKYKNKIN